MSMDFQSSDQPQRRYEDLSEALKQGHLNKASRMLRESLADCLISGSVDPSLLMRAEALAERYELEGEFAPAAAMYRSLHEVQTIVLGKDHPRAMRTRQKLAEALCKTGGLTPGQLTD